MNVERMWTTFTVIGCLFISSSTESLSAQELQRETVLTAAQQAVRFYRENVGVSGGSVYQVSADLTLREGEVRVGAREVWIEPPATSAVGMTYLNAWQLTGEKVFHDAMLEVANALVRGQLESGGWGENIEFDPLLRPRYAYRVDHRTDLKRLQNRTTFDDNKSQSSLKFLILLDHELKFSNPQIHEAALFALESFEKAQYPNGAWPQRFDGETSEFEGKLTRARFPQDWNRTYQKISYAGFYTLNDQTLSDLVNVMLCAYQVYGDERWLNCARRGGEFLIAAQLPEPQPGWAQQYNLNMEPEWARKFEPPAITGLESQSAMQTLLVLYDQTGDEKFLKPVPRALEYYRSLLLKDGQLARFYELKTDRPLYFTRKYQLVYTDDDLPTHYGFKVGSKLDRIEQTLQKLQERGASKPSLIRPAKKPGKSASLTKRVESILKSLDQRGAWVQSGSLKNYSGNDQVDKVISTRTYSSNLLTLAEFLSANE